MKLTRNQYISILYIVIFAIMMYVAFLFNQSAQPSVISENLWTQNNHVYYKIANCRDRAGLVEISADPKTLHIYNEDYFGDKNKLWNTDGSTCGVPTEVDIDPPVDIKSFRILSSDTNLAQDAYGLISIYRLYIEALGVIRYDSFRIQDIDGFDVKYISDNILTSNGKVYHYDSNYYNKTPSIKELVGVDSDILHVYKSDDLTSCLYLVTTAKVFSFCHYQNNSISEIESADPLTFHKLKGSDYWADVHSVFFKGKKLQDAFSSDFIKIKASRDYYYSNGHIYIGNKKLADVPTPDAFILIKGQLTFETGMCGMYTYWTDGKKVYYNDQILDLNPNNIVFTTYPGTRCVATGYVHDSNNFFFDGKKVEGVDPTSFRIIVGRHARDKNHFYMSGVTMTGNPDELEKDALAGKLDQSDYSGCDM